MDVAPAASSTAIACTPAGISLSISHQNSHSSFYQPPAPVVQLPSVRGMVVHDPSITYIATGVKKLEVRRFGFKHDLLALLTPSKNHPTPSRVYCLVKIAGVVTPAVIDRHWPTQTLHAHPKGYQCCWAIGSYLDVRAEEIDVPTGGAQGTFELTGPRQPALDRIREFLAGDPVWSDNEIPAGLFQVFFIF